MSDENKKYKVEFAPGVLETLEEEMSPDELQEFMNQIAEKMQNGSFFTEAVEVDMDALKEEDPELYAAMLAFEQQDDSDNPTIH